MDINFSKKLVKVDKEVDAVTNAIYEIEYALDDESFFLPNGDDEYGRCVIDVNIIRASLDDLERALM